MIDISMPLQDTTPIWPGSPGVARSTHRSLEAGDEANVTILTMDVHAGTHIDAPRHFLRSGATVEEIGLEELNGPAWVADATGHAVIDADVLDGLRIPRDTSRLLLSTDNSLRPRESAFREDYVALSSDAAVWVVERGLSLIGIDYLSIQRFGDPPDTHVTLLRAGTVILEGLELSSVEPGRWTLACLPLRLVGVEAAPVRAVLWEV